MSSSTTITTTTSLPLSQRPSRTALGPLTTTFSIPAECGVALTVGPNECMLGQLCTSNTIEDAASCWPSPENGVTITWPAYGGGVYSPGLVCPSSYSTACIATEGVAGGFDFQFPLEPGETAVGCCPSGFGCSQYTESGSLRQTCTTSISTGSFLAGRCNENSIVAAYQTVPFLSSDTATTRVLTDFLVEAPLFQIAWKTSDLPAGRSTQVPSSNTASATPTATASSNPTQSSSASPGISTGAVAGIGIACTLAGLAIVSSIVWFILRRRKKQSCGRQDMGQDLMDPYQKVPTSSHVTSYELMGTRDPGNNTTVVAEKGWPLRSELSASRAAAELE